MNKMKINLLKFVKNYINDFNSKRTKPEGLINIHEEAYTRCHPSQLEIEHYFEEDVNEYKYCYVKYIKSDWGNWEITSEMLWTNTNYEGLGYEN